MGGELATLAGLAGLGDLVLTCTGDLSRNRTVGTRLAQGETIEQITGSMRQVAEGVKNTSTILALAQRLGVEMPIIEAVRGVLEQKAGPHAGPQRPHDPRPQARGLLILFVPNFHEK